MKNLYLHESTIIANTQASGGKLCPAFMPFPHEKNINKIVNMPKINRGKLYNRMLFRNVYENRNWCPDGWRESRRKAELNECAVRVCLLQINDDWKIHKRDGKTIFIKSCVIWKWRIFTFEMKFCSFSLILSFHSTDQRAVLLCKHRYESALFHFLYLTSLSSSQILDYFDYFDCC